MPSDPSAAGDQAQPWRKLDLFPFNAVEQRTLANQAKQVVYRCFCRFATETKAFLDVQHETIAGGFPCVFVRWSTNDIFIETIVIGIKTITIDC